MWEVHRGARRLAVWIIAALAGTGGANAASAQDTVINQNISGFNLPGVQLPQGHDEVRAADGTTCRSAVSGSGAYLDVGVIGNPERDTVEASFSAYGRLVVPLGRTAPRLDCSLLYDLEVQRLAIELKLSQMGLNRGFAPMSEEVPHGGAPQFGGAAEADEDAKQTAAKKLASVGASDKSAARIKTGDWADEGWTTEGRREN